MKTANRAFENVEQLKYLGMTETNQILIPKEINLYETVWPYDGL
jgi:hypothetical protein